MSDTNHSPVSLPAGSFDYDVLKAGLGAAARGSASNYESAVADALNEAGTIPHQSQDARDIPGYKFVEREDETLGVKERIQVYDPDQEPKPEADAGPTEADRMNNQAQTTARSVAKAGSPKE